MSDNEIRLPPTEPPEQRPPQDNQPHMQEEPATFEGCMVALGKIIIALVIGVFVLGALVFATCFLSLRR